MYGSRFFLCRCVCQSSVLRSTAAAWFAVLVFRQFVVDTARDAGSVGAV